MSTRVSRAAASAGRSAREQDPVVDEPPPAGVPGGFGGPGGPGGPGDPGNDPDPQGNQGNALPPQGGPNIPFALVPAQASQGVIDYSRPEGVKQFLSATRSLYADSSELFNCDLDSLWDYLQLVKQRSNMMGFHAIFQVPHRETPAAQPIVLDFLHNYGVFSLQEVQEHALTYIGTQTRAAQDSIMLYYFLWNSLSATGRAKVGVKSEDYVLNGITAGVPLLKVIIDDSGIETHATVTNIRTQLSKLDEYMATVDSDIQKFNIHVKTLMNGLRNHRQTSTDLLIHLFKGYKACSDVEFVQFIRRKEETYEEGVDLLPQRLMTLAEEKYKIRINRGDWKAPGETDKRILALEAKIKTMGLKKPAKEQKNKPKGKGPAAATPEKAKKREIPDWMTKPPKPGEENKSKQNEGKEYWWCTALKRWCRHKPVDCRANKPNKDNKFQGKGAQQKKLKFAKALEAIETHDQDDTEDSE